MTLIAPAKLLTGGVRIMTGVSWFGLIAMRVAIAVYVGANDRPSCLPVDRRGCRRPLAGFRRVAKLMVTREYADGR